MNRRGFNVTTHLDLSLAIALVFGLAVGIDDGLGWGTLAALIAWLCTGVVLPILSVILLDPDTVPLTMLQNAVRERLERKYEDGTE